MPLPFSSDLPCSPRSIRVFSPPHHRRVELARDSRRPGEAHPHSDFAATPPAAALRGSRFPEAIEGSLLLARAHTRRTRRRRNRAISRDRRVEAEIGRSAARLLRRRVESVPSPGSSALFPGRVAPGGRAFASDRSSSCRLISSARPLPTCPWKTFSKRTGA